MAFQAPTFNITCNVWTGTSPPPAAARITGLPCQLRAAGKQSTGQDQINSWSFLWLLLVAKGTDLRDYANTPSGSDILEVPAGSLRYYTVQYVDDVARGFTNEYRVAMLLKRAPWPTPNP